MNKVQTDNSYLEEKIFLRVKSIEEHMPKKQEIRVLECFAGDGYIWGEVRKRLPDRKIKVLRIDQKPDKKGVYLNGDNLKFIANFNLDAYDIVDLDAYSTPFNQLEIVLRKDYKGVVHCTFIQSMYGGLNQKMLNDIGYPESMVKKIPSLFNKNGLEKLKYWLSIYGIKEIIGYSFDWKHYFYFKNA